MRVALLYSGLPRMWRQCHQTQLRLFPDAQIDVFFHFWDTVPEREKWAIIDTMRPKDFIFETPRDYGFVDRYPEVRPDSINVPSRMISQYMSWRKVATLFQPYAPRYDLAVRSRSDLYFHDGIHYDLTNVTNGNISLVAFHWPEDQRMLSDLFAIGSPRAIVYYLSLIDHIWQYTHRVNFNPEGLITRHLLAFSSKREPFILYTIPDFPFFVFRPHMVGWPPEQCRAEGPGVSKWRDPEVVDAHRRYHAAAHGEAGRQHVERFAMAQLANGVKPPEPPAKQGPTEQQREDKPPPKPRRRAKAAPA